MLCDHYLGRGLMRKYASGADLAEAMGVPLQTLVAVHDAHYAAARQTAAEPEGGPYAA